jgi:hypothetical protein
MALRPTKQLEATILCTDPLVEEEAGLGKVRVRFDCEPGFGDGPTSSSVAVVDYNADLDRVLAPARLLKNGKGFAVGKLGRPRENLLFHQVNVWAVIQRTVALLEDPKLFGRPIPWQSGRGRLLVLPHAGYGSNAFYDRGTGALHFLYFEGRDGRPVYTCLSHDIVTHELGHAVLDGLKPYYNEISSVQTAGFHEYFGDALAIASSLTFREVLARAVGAGARTLGTDLIGRIAREFGTAMPGGAGHLRAASEKKTVADLKGVYEEHDHSKLLTNVFFSFLGWLYERRLRKRMGRASGKVKGNDAVAALVTSARQAARTFFRGLDYCAPTDVTYLDYARAILVDDEVGYRGDEMGARAQIRRLFKERGVAKSDDEFAPERPLRNRDLRPYDVERIAATPEEAYRFLDANRDAERLDIPYGANLLITKLIRTRKISEGGYYPPREVILEFVWPEDVTLDGVPHRDLRGKRFTLWCGGTLVFDHDGNVLSYALRKATQERKQDLLRYVTHLSSKGRIGLAGLDTDFAGRDRHRVVAEADAQRARLRRNPALRHEGR